MISILVRRDLFASRTFQHLVHLGKSRPKMILAVTKGNAVNGNVKFKAKPFILQPLDFYLVFPDIHLWSTVFALLMMNYVFQDGVSDYFQGEELHI